MDELYEMLRRYNVVHERDQMFVPWAKQYTKHQCPRYWKYVFGVLSRLDKGLKVIEIGCGLGDITAILCYLKYTQFVAFERDEKISRLAHDKILNLFGMAGVVQNMYFPQEEVIQSDLLILVNCAYKDYSSSKREYMDMVENYYRYAGNPRYFLMEAIDASYTLHNDEFPEHIRLSRDDIRAMFPDADIEEWKTYSFPENAKSKTLYLISK